jgi:phospholipase C
MCHGRFILPTPALPSSATFSGLVRNTQTSSCPLAQYFQDVANGTLPSVALIEPGYVSGLDEHPNKNVQSGAAFVSKEINGLMNSPSWKDSVFILTYDEGGSFYDHVPPQPAVIPDGTPPSDLNPGDTCMVKTGANSDCNHTAYRVADSGVSLYEEAVCLTYGRRLHRDFEIDGNSLSNPKSHSARCRTDGYDRVL